jgi:cell division septum initiation protein DivIVA
MAESSVLPDLLKGIRAKTEKVIALHETLNRENELLRKQVKQLKNRVEELEKEQVSFRDELQALRLAGKISGTESTESSLAIKLKINELVREIDKCIAQLNR